MQGVKKHLELILISLLLMVLVFAAYIHTNNGYKASATVETLNTSDYIHRTIDEGVETLKESAPEVTMSREDIELIALVTMAEAEGESELGKRLVIDTILNRIDNGAFPDTLNEVIYQPYQYECMTNGRVDRCEVREDICQLVIEELRTRTDDSVLFFRTMHYHNFGTPVLQEGAHYFSTL